MVTTQDAFHQQLSKFIDENLPNALEAGINAKWWDCDLMMMRMKMIMLLMMMMMIMSRIW